MMWVIRAGKGSVYYNKFIANRKIYIPWDGYDFDFSTIETRSEYSSVVEKEKGTDNRISVSSWAGQLYSFARVIQKGDYVLIPSKASKMYCLAQVTGEYFFDGTEPDKLYHSRSIDILYTNIPKEIFSQSIIYSLGAFRTLFKAKYEDEILTAINTWERRRNETTV